MTEANEDTPKYPYLHVLVPSADAEIVCAELWDLGAEGVEEQDATTMSGGPGEGMTRLVAFMGDEENSRAAMAHVTTRYESRIEYVIGDEWRDAWKAYFKPTKVGPRLLVRPSWEEVTPEAGDVVLTMDPGRAFGSGIHESTRLLMRAIDERASKNPALMGTLLDVGCGSGILSIAALLLGAKDAIAIDIEDAAAEVTLENADANGLSGRIKASTTPVGEIEGTFALVLANIQAVVLVPLAREIAAKVAPGGELYLSGILKGQEDEVRAAYPEFELIDSPTENDWIALLLRKKED